VRGRHLVTGLPTAVLLRSEEVRAAIAGPLREILQAIRDTLPYFLGAVQAEEITLRRRLVEARRDLRRAERDLAEARRTRLEGDARLAALTGEAVEVGLLDSSALDADDRVGLLRVHAGCARV